MNKLSKLAPAWHADAADLLRKNFDIIHSAFLDSTKKAVALGLFLTSIKQRGKEDGSIPHGEFMPWCDKNVPGLKHWQLSQYMRLAIGVVEFGKLQIGDFTNFAYDGNLPPEIEQLIANKTQKQLFLQFHAEKQPASYHPPRADCIERKLANRRALADDVAKDLLGYLRTMMQGDTWSNLSTSRQQEIEEERLTFGHWIKTHSPKSTK